MKIKTITVGRGLTINLGDYESARLDVSIGIDLDDGDDPDEVYQMASDFIDQKLEQDMDALKDG